MPLKKPRAGFYILSTSLMCFSLFLAWSLSINPLDNYDVRLQVADIYASQNQFKKASHEYNDVIQTLLEATLLSSQKALRYLKLSWRNDPNPRTHGNMLYSILTRSPLRDTLKEIEELQRKDPLLLEAMMLASKSKPVYLNNYEDGWSNGKEAACLVSKNHARSTVVMTFNYSMLPSSFFPVTLSIKSPSSTHPSTIIQKVITTPQNARITVPLEKPVNLISITSDKDFTPKEVNWDNSLRRLGFSYTVEEQPSGQTP